MARISKSEQVEALERLREWISPGDEVFTILRHVSRSGMLRTVDVIGIGDKSEGRSRVWSYGWNAAQAIGWTYDRQREGVRVTGGGMDMGFQLVYTLSRVMFPEGFDCIGEGCPSNDHANGDPDYSPHRHADGGYALRQRWL